MVFSTGRLLPSSDYERAIRLPSPKEHSMLKVLAFLQNFRAKPLCRDDRGVTAVEYALLLVLIAGVIATGVGFFGNALSTFFTNFAAHF
jgi:Flp pilus assembly pilin Flp